MNIKTGLKTLAVALPLAVSPMKSKAQMVTKQAEKDLNRVVLKGNIGGGYGQTTVLYSDMAGYIKGGLHLDIEASKNKVFYQDAKILAGKDILQGRYEMGYSTKLNKNFELSAGGYISRDFKAPEFIEKEEVTEPKMNVVPLVSGLMQVGATAKAALHPNKNLEIFAKADVANVTYSSVKESVYPFVIDGKHLRLDNKYIYEKSVSPVAGSIESGTKMKIDKLDLTAKGGYNTFNGLSFGVDAKYNFNLVNKPLK